MKQLLLALTLLLAMPAFSQGILTDSYISELEQNIEELQALEDAGLASERDTFMLNYYKKKLGQTRAAASGTASRMVFTTAIDNKEPTNSLESITTSQRQVFFFTELVNLNGKTVTHRWSYKGEVVYTKDFKVGANRWRVWTAKTITPYAGGTVVVQVLVDGQAYTQETIRVTN